MLGSTLCGDFVIVCVPFYLKQVGVITVNSEPAALTNTK